MKSRTSARPLLPTCICATSIATPDGRILCQFMTEKSTSLIFDPATREVQLRPRRSSAAGVAGRPRGTATSCRAGKVFDGKTLDEVTPPPFPTPPADKGVGPSIRRLTDPRYAVPAPGNAIYRYKIGEKDLTLHLRPGSSRRRADRVDQRTASLLGVRGQDYFVVRPGDKDVKLKPIPVESSTARDPVPAGRPQGHPLGRADLRADPLAHGPQDEEGRQHEHGLRLRRRGLRRGVRERQGLRRRLRRRRYDRVRPGAALGPVEPQEPESHRRCRHQGLHPARRRRSLGPDGKLYTGWLAKYGTYGGAVSITDPKTGETELIENPLGEQAILRRALPTADFIYVGSCLAGNGLPAKTGEGPGSA